MPRSNRAGGRSRAADDRSRASARSRASHRGGHPAAYDDDRSRASSGSRGGSRSGSRGGGDAYAKPPPPPRVGVREVRPGAYREGGPAGDRSVAQSTGSRGRRAAKLRENELDVMERQDERLKKAKTADEELEGRSLWDLVDRGTMIVGCTLILIVIIAVSIPLALISEDEPYVAPPEPPKPSASPTRARSVDEEAIGEQLARITPGGLDVLMDPTTAHHRAWQWLVYEDGMELGAEKDHLHQRFVLYIIYLVSGPWTPVEGRLEWGSPVHECEWEGIYCKDVEELEAELEGRIEELLEVGREDGIKIDIPRRIANRLELRQRLVSGEVPAEFSLLYYLQHLDLENNKLVGGLPAPLYKLFNLETLFLEQNDLTNVDAIGEYRHLEHVALGKNNFRGTIPTSFANLKKLKTLYLHTNAFSGQVFDVLQEFTQLELLDIAFNEFSGTLPSEMGNMKNLTSAFLGHNQFEGTLPDALANCKNLQEFQMDGSHDMTGPIPSFLGSLPKLRFLKLDTCAFTGVLPMSLGNLQNLEFLDVNSNELRGKIPSQLGKATSLKTLGLANNGFQGTVPSHLGSLTKLEKAYFQNTDLGGEMPPEVCALRRRGNRTKLEVLFVPCDVECDMDTCCTLCS